MPHNFDVVCIGNAKIDAFLSIHEANDYFKLNKATNELCIRSGQKITVDKCTFSLGGNAANVAVGLSRLGYSSSICAEIGDDEFSQKIINTLKQEGVNTDFLKQSKGEACSCSVILSFKGERTIFSEHVRRKHEFVLDNISAKWVYLTSIGEEWKNAYKKAFEFVRQTKCLLAFNPGTLQINAGITDIADVLSTTKILFVNKEEAIELSNINYQISNKADDEEIIKRLLELLQKLGSKIVVITDGKNGSCAIDEKGEIFMHGTVPCQVVEKTGAGDAYSTGFLAATLHGLSIREAMRWGAVNSASVIEQIGAQKGLLRKEEIEKNFRNLFMINNLGYNKNLFILPFDHRSSFVQDMFGIKDQNLTPQETQLVISAKETIYEGFKKAVEEDVPKDSSAILVDEQFGDKIIRDAREKGFTTILTTEKSGQKEFAFEYNGEFSKHIEKYKPTFAKALVRYNPEDDEQSKIRQQRNLKILSDYCHNNGYKFLLEVLIPPTNTSEESLRNTSEVAEWTPPRWTQERYDKEIRPKLAPVVIEELHNANIEPDVWKLEGMDNKKDYEAIVNQAKSAGRDTVGIVILGRGSDQKQVEKWILVGVKVKGVIGFAVGRTVFWQPLMDLKNGKISKEEAIDQIANNFKYFYDVFMKGKIEI